MKKKYRIVSRTRFFMFAITMSTIGIMSLMSLLSINQAYGSIHEYDYHEIKVVEGDTLWFLALDYTPENYDVRRMIYDIKRFNEMDTSCIYPGDLIRIPLIKSYD